MPQAMISAIAAGRNGQVIWKNEVGQRWRVGGSLSSYDKSWYTLHTEFYVPESTKDGKNAKPAVLIEVEGITTTGADGVVDILLFIYKSRPFILLLH